MKTRAITGFFFVIVMLASLITGAYTFTIFYIVLSLLCLSEFYALVKKNITSTHSFMGYFIAFLLFALTAGRYFYNIDTKYFLILIPLCSSLFIRELYKYSKNPFSDIGYTFLGIIYTVVPFIFYHGIAFISGEYNPHLALGFFLMLWSSDTGAYLFGVKFGKRRLFERHSPKKSWEGFFGGVLVSVVVALIISSFYTEYAAIHWVAMALIISCFGTMADLVESMFKRSINVKDSGNLLPGHGGVLDRFDGLLISAPLVFVYLYLISY